MFQEINGIRKCPSCCLTCAIQPPAIAISSLGPCALGNLLPAGTIHIPVSSGESSCDHHHGEDGWHTLRGHPMLQRLLTPEDDSLLRELDFLITHLFISCTCRLNRLGNVLHVRVYLIPHDLANVQGRLRIRDETTILAPARRYLKILFQRIVQDDILWEGDDASSSLSPKPFISQDIDNRTMAEIYSDLPSPRISPDHAVSSLIHNVLSGEKIYGMRSKLYPYQSRSVAAMIQKETQPVDIPDPLFVPIVGIDGNEFYLQPATMEILQERPMVQQNRGGVLCEELGTGKTVMILALVLATIDQLPSPEESILDTRPVMTPLAFRAFPSADFIAARKRATRRPKDNGFPPGPRVPSLVELLLHHIRVSPESLDAREFEEDLEVRKLLHFLQHNTPFYHHYDVELARNERSRRKQSHPGPRMVYLTTASLILVPANLVAQWDNEILKHCRSGLRVLVLKSKTQMPRAKALASDYDIVLISHLRFAAEANKSNVAKSNSWNVCPCPGFKDSPIRIPNCQCNNAPDLSPLLQIRWKRLVIDEGHVAAATSTNLAGLTQLISAERRWIVTGTPTTNLLGLNFGRNTEQNEVLDAALEPPSSSTSDTSSSIPPSVVDDTENHTETARRWTANDREDLRKLATMMTHFLKVPHFAANPKLLNHVILPLLDTRGPCPGAIQVLNQVMSMIMIRHQVEDVEKDVLLPPIKQEIVLLDLDPHAMMSYNAMQAAIAINAVDSERTDQDYLFHPRNVTSLLRAMTNLSQIMFWSIADDLYNVHQLSKNRQKHLEMAMTRKVPDSDLALLNLSFDHIARAANDPLWEAMHAHEDVPYRVFSMPRPLSDAWTRVELKLGHSNLERSSQDSLPMVFMHPDRLIKLRETVLGRPLISTESLIQWGSDVNAEDRQRRRWYLEHQKLLKKNKRDKDNDSHSSTIDSVRKVVAPDKMKEVQKELFVAQKRRDALADETDGISAPGSVTVKNTPTADDAEKAILLASSPLAGVRVGQTASSKLNYILNDVLRYSSKEKFLIFSQSPLTLAHIAEGLDLMMVKALRFTTQVSAHEREQLVMTFETSETYRVFLMELKHGARGLNLIAASRVIFCEPVWQADVESQAIKRAHRIGQTRPISVKTLAIRATAEEAMVARREALKSRSGKLPSMTEEVGMRYFIENPAFLTESTLVPLLNFALINTELATKSKEVDSDTIAVSDETHVRFVDSKAEHEPPVKKRKGVRFADEEGL